MSAVLIVIIAVIVVAALAAAYRASRKKKLRASFGPEYDQLVQDGGSSREADRELARRKHEHAKLDLKPISEQDRASFLESWEHLQASFIDDPVFSMNSAENLVSRALEVRGYPGGDREEQLALLSVEYSGKLTDYRAAQGVKRQVEAATGPEAAGTASTEEIRQALLAYRALFDELLSTSGAEVTRPTLNESTGTETVPAQEWNVPLDGPVNEKVEH